MRGSRFGRWVVRLLAVAALVGATAAGATTSVSPRDFDWGADVSADDFDWGANPSGSAVVSR